MNISEKKKENWMLFFFYWGVYCLHWSFLALTIYLVGACLQNTWF